MKAYVLVNIRTGSVKEVVGHLRRVASVVEANMTFGPYDAVASCFMRRYSASVRYGHPMQADFCKRRWG